MTHFNPYRAGAYAYLYHQPRAANPYAKGSRQHAQWDQGWAGQAQAAGELPEDTPALPPPHPY